MALGIWLSFVKTTKFLGGCLNSPPSVRHWCHSHLTNLHGYYTDATDERILSHIKIGIIQYFAINNDFQANIFSDNNVDTANTIT
jgi:hypothetical protein